MTAYYYATHKYCREMNELIQQKTSLLCFFFNVDQSLVLTAETTIRTSASSAMLELFTAVQRWRMITLTTR